MLKRIQCPALNDFNRKEIPLTLDNLIHKLFEVGQLFLSKQKQATLLITVMLCAFSYRILVLARKAGMIHIVCLELLP